MLQLHDIIENMPEGDDTTPQGKSLKITKRMLTLFSQHENGACFDFGDVETIDNDTWLSLSEYAHDLLQNDMFQLPYMPVYYSWTRAGDNFGAYIYQKAPDTLDIVYFCAEKRPFILALIGTIESVFNRKEKQLCTNASGRMIYMSPFVELIDEGAESALMQSIVGHAIILTSLMQSTNTRTRITEYSKKFNDKRLKRGLPQIMPFHTVYFDVGGRRYNTDGTEQNGTHASPRLHWRRGHIRKLGEGRMTHVRPHLVGAMGQNVDVAKPKYELRYAK